MCINRCMHLAVDICSMHVIDIIRMWHQKLHLVITLVSVCNLNTTFIQSYTPLISSDTSVGYSELWNIAFGKIKMRYFTMKLFKTLTLYTLISVCIFSILFSTNFIKGPTRRICLTINSFLVSDRLLYSWDLNAWFRCHIVRRN